MKNDRAIAAWLLACCAMVFAMVLLGVLLVAAQGGGASAVALVRALCIALLIGAATYFVTARLSDAAGAVAKSFTLPSGASTPYEQTFSFQESMAVRGDVAGGASKAAG